MKNWIKFYQMLELHQLNVQIKRKSIQSQNMTGWVLLKKTQNGSWILYLNGMANVPIGPFGTQLIWAPDGKAIKSQCKKIMRNQPKITQGLQLEIQSNVISVRNLVILKGRVLGFRTDSPDHHMHSGHLRILQYMRSLMMKIYFHIQRHIGKLQINLGLQNIRQIQSQQ